MANVAQVLAILDRESVRSTNAADMRRVMSEMANELRSATQRKPRRGEVVEYDGVGEVEFGGTSASEVSAHIGRKLESTIRTMRNWGVEVAS